METVSGYFVNTIMRDLQSGYTVFRINTGTEVIICQGNIIVPAEGVKVEVTGTLKNTKYGQQLCECTIEENYTDTDGLKEYLQTIPGIGERIANDLVSIYGGELFDIALRENGEKYMACAPSVSEKKAETIVKYIRKTKAYRELFEIITEHGGKFSLVRKIYTEFGETSVRKLLEDPYIFVQKYNMDFSTADTIARKHGMLAYDMRRIRGAASYILRKEITAGNTFLTYADVVTQTKRLLSVSEQEEAIAAAAIGCTLQCSRDLFKIEDDMIYLQFLYMEEIRTAKAIKRLLRAAVPIEGKNAQDLIDMAQAACHAKYAPEQQQAFQLLLNGGVGIVTGGPGTGKSTVINGLLAAYCAMYPANTVKLCAPTGRAAQRMKEVTNHEATTIHKLLEYCPFGETVSCKNENDPIEADLLIVDESSMISIDLASLLFNAIKPGTTVLLVGDIDQLPAVGAGNVLQDLIGSEVIPTVRLIKTYRQAGGSKIIDNAKAIRDGVLKLQSGDDFEIIECEDDKIPEVVTEEFQKYYQNDNVFAAQVLTPGRKKRATGSQKLSQTLQMVCDLKKSPMLRYGDMTYHIGDKVMFLRNNYADGYYNGDIGVVSTMDDSSLDVLVEDEVIHVSEENLEDIVLAYAITIHKSQGSECNTAICVLPSQPANMLQRNLIYTAITRAKKKVVLIAAPGSIRKSIQNRCIHRNSKLQERLRE